jgi:hypothetical protein
MKAVTTMLARIDACHFAKMNFNNMYYICQWKRASVVLTGFFAATPHFAAPHISQTQCWRAPMAE